jgi:hypothetical protein
MPVLVVAMLLVLPHSDYKSTIQSPIPRIHLHTNTELIAVAAERIVD